MKRFLLDPTRFNNIGISKHKVDDFVIYCNSLERLPGRRERFLSLTKPFRKCMPIFIHDAIDWKIYELQDLNFEGFNIYKKWKLDENKNSWWNTELKMGSICNGIGHYHIWKHIQQNGFKYSIIMEDDVTFELNFFIERLNIFYEFASNNDIDLIKLGSTNAFINDIPYWQGENVNEHIQTCGYEFCTHAYIVTQNAVDRLLNWGYKECMITTDEFFSYAGSLHPRKDIEDLYGNQEKLKMYRFKYDCVNQYIKNNIESGSEVQLSKEVF